MYRPNFFLEGGLTFACLTSALVRALAGRPGAYSPRKILKCRVSQMLFPPFEIISFLMFVCWKEQNCFQINRTIAQLQSTNFPTNKLYVSGQIPPPPASYAYDSSCSIKIFPLKFPFKSIQGNLLSRSRSKLNQPFTTESYNELIYFVFAPSISLLFNSFPGHIGSRKSSRKLTNS